MRRTALTLTLLAAPSLLAQSPSPYRITHTYTLGGDGSWDYIVPDPRNHRLFIGRQDRVMVVDENNGTLLGEVTGIDGAHGTAVAAAAGHGFATSGRDQSVVMFDLKTLKTLARIPAAEDADAIIYDSASNHVFTFNGDAHSSTVIDPRAGKLITNIALGGKPEYGASSGDGKVYANLTDTSEVARSTRRTPPCCGDGPPLRAGSRCRWRSTPAIIACSVAAAAACWRCRIIRTVKSSPPLRSAPA
jgi:hypothetical protein